MHIRLKQGDEIRVMIEDCEFIIGYSKDAVMIEASMPDRKGREGVIYMEPCHIATCASQRLFDAKACDCTDGPEG